MKVKKVIPFNRPLFLGGERDALNQVIESGTLSGNGPYTNLCEQWLEHYSGALAALLTPSCTHALEMAALLINIEPGDEVIMPSWTFVSTSNAFVLRGAVPVYVDVEPDTCNLDVELVESAITNRTKAIVPVHYGGISCDMGAIMDVAKRNNLWVIEDAAQALMSSYDGAPVGSIGHLGTYSFHATKNYTSGGEGGALLVNAPELVERARVIREKGTNREDFISGNVSRYEWVDVGSSYLPGELQAAYLYTQLKQAQKVNQCRSRLWEEYRTSLAPFSENKGLRLPCPPRYAAHNGHMFFVRARDRAEKDRLLIGLNQAGIMAQTHYEPLHMSCAGKRFGRFYGSDIHTLDIYDTLIRLPLYYSLGDEEQQYVIDKLKMLL